MDEKRREKGSGSIYQRKDGKWVSQIDLGRDSKGKRVNKYIYGKSEADVKRKMKAFNKEHSKDDPIEIKKMTVKQFMDNWLFNTKKRELKPSSYDRLEMTLTNQVYPYLGDIQINSITSDDVENMINKLSDAGKSYSTIKKAYEAVNSCFKTNIIRKKLRDNPALGISLPSSKTFDKEEMYTYDTAAREKIITEATRKFGTGTNAYRLGQGIVLLMYTGMRIGEALMLRWDDIDYDNKRLTIRGNMVAIRNRDPEVDKRYVYVDQNTAKSAAGKRIVSLPQKAINALQEMQKITGTQDKVFSTKSGKSVSPRNIDRLFRNVLTVCKLPLHGVHSLRHTFASMLFEQGVDVKIVSELLGHSDVFITYKTYIHLIDKQKLEAISVLDKI